MITLTKAINAELDYDDEIHINPDHIKTMRRIAMAKDEDSIVVTEIECGLIIMGEDGSVGSEVVLVLEEPAEIAMRVREWARSLRSA